jgi:YD repeat-containing protein
MNRPVSATWLNVAAQTTPAGSSVVSSFTYDATNRRIGQTVDDDSWWNRPTAASSISYAANSLNQYTAVGSASPTYDGNGNLTYDGHFTYCYDTESRLTSVLSAGTCAAPTTTVASYAYDGQGRRKSKTVGATTTVYVTDADNREVLEYDGTSGALQNWYAFGLGPDEALNQMNVASNPNTRQTLIPDVIGSIVGSLDSGGTLTKFGYQTRPRSPRASTITAPAPIPRPGAASSSPTQAGTRLGRASTPIPITIPST